MKRSFTKPVLLFLSLFLLNSFSMILLAQPAFTDVTVAKGFSNPINPVLPLEHDGGEVMDGVGRIGSGAAWLDFNDDGYLDLYMTMRDGANRLYENSGPPNYIFTEKAGTYNLQDATGDGSGVGIADFDNDGDDDIYVCNTNVDKLFRNDGATFTDVTSSAGLSTTNESRSTSMSWGDYDKDGYLDFYVSRHAVYSGNNGDRQDQLYHNDGDGTFTDVSSLLDVNLLMGLGFIGGFTDFDNDGYLDIIVINDCNFIPEEGRTRIFRNDGGTDGVNDWAFTEVAASVGVDDCSNGMGLAIGDINHDGFQEFVNSDIGVINLWLNSNGMFSDITAPAGVDNQDAGHYSWGTNLFDHNNDGWLDLFVLSGSLQYLSGVDPQPNYFYENEGTTGETFTDKSATLEMGDNQVGRNSITGDFDNDGDLDVFIINYDEEVMLRQNNNVTNNWVKINLRGQFDTEGEGYSNRDGIGAKVEITTPDNVTQTIEVRAGSSLGGSEQKTAHFGLGLNTSITELRIIWPSGIVQTISNIAVVNTTLNLIETPDSPLAVDLINFEVKPYNQQAILEWETASETDNDFFRIERSSDGRTFERIGIIEGNGTTSTTSSYNFTDKRPGTGDNYYRLAQTDFDGETSYSPIKLLRFETQISKLEVAPNPVSNGQFTASFNTPDRQVVLELIDVFGKSVMREYFTHDGVQSDRIISVKNLPNGMYILRLAGTSTQEITKIIVR